MRQLATLLAAAVLVLSSRAAGHSVFAQASVRNDSKAVQPPPLSDLVSRIKPSVVTVLVYEDERGTPTAQGTGWFWKPGQVVTNRHVIEDGIRAEIRLASGVTVPVLGILGDSLDHDLAVLSAEVTQNRPPAIPLASAPPREGDRVFIIGSPLGLEHTVSEGIVSAVRDVPSLGTIIQTTAAVSPGSSGSPVLDMRGRVIGVATSRMVRGQSLNFAVPADAISTLKLGTRQTLGAWRTVTGRDSGSDEYWLGLEASIGGRFEDALRHAQVATQAKPSDAKAWFLLAGVFFSLDRHQEAMAAWKKGIRIKADVAEPHYFLGIAYARLGRQQEAIDAYKRAIRIDPALAAAHYDLGLAYFRLGRHREAVNACKQAIRIDPNLAEAHNLLGMAYTALGRDRGEAINAYKQSIRIDPDDGLVHVNLGIEYYKLGRYQEAIDAYKQAIRIKPDHALAHFALGGAYLKTGNKGGALDEYKILKDLDREKSNQLFDMIYK